KKRNTERGPGFLFGAGRAAAAPARDNPPPDEAVCKSLSIFAENTRNGRTAENRRKIHAPRTKRGPQSVK
ncbi:MAG: hypothetical protein UCP03_06850, partial [Alistipes onderdonkii]